jgi:pimeloyl-ACP methyl ester carboxylesterase
LAETFPLILLPGMGADRRLFQRQIESLENVLAPDWIAPEPRDTLATYAERMAGTFDPGGPCFVGGASFGGMVALEMTRHLDARACFLIGSIRSPDQLPLRLRLLKPLASVLPSWSLALPRGLARVMLATVGPLLRPATRSVLQQFADSDGRFVRWASLAILAWQGPPEPPIVPVFQIHGDRDRVLPHRMTRPDVLVRGAGHLLSITFPDAVNQFLKSHMDELSTG